MKKKNKRYLAAVILVCLSLLLSPWNEMILYADEIMAEDSATVEEVGIPVEEEESHMDDLPELDEEQTAHEETEQQDESEPLSERVTVYDFENLKKALQNDITTHVTLGASIQMTGGIQVNAAKPLLVIDGRDSEGVIHTLTDFHSASQGYTIYLNTNGILKDITLSNLKLIGKNYYGPVSVYDNVRNAVITYYNIDYKGPQLTFNRYGKAIYRDIVVSLGRYQGACPGEELGEVSSAVFDGTILVEQADAQAQETIWVAVQDGTIEVMPNASVEIKVLTDSGFLQSSRQVTMTVHESASFNFYGVRRFWEGTALAGLDVKAGARFHVSASGVLFNSLLRLNNSLNVSEGAEFSLINSGASTFPVLAMYAGDAVFNNPRHVLLYSKNFRPIYYEYQRSLQITAQQLNYWRTAGTGDFHDLPMYQWRKEDQTDLTLTATIGTGTSGELMGVQTNYNLEQDNSAAVMPDNNSLRLTSMRALSFGTLDISANYRNNGDNGIVVQGSSAGGSNIMITRINPESGEQQLGDIIKTDSAGSFSAELDYILSDGDQLWVTANLNYLFTPVNTQNMAGLLTIQAEDLKYQDAEISVDTQLIHRESYAVTINDQRGIGQNWKLMARQASPFRSGDQNMMSGSLVFIDQAGTEHSLLEQDVLVYQNASTTKQDITTINWADDKGILLKMPFGNVKAGQSYTAEVVWTLVDGP